MLDRIIDSHTHCFPDGVAPKAVASLAATSFLSPVGSGSAAGLVQSMKSDGIYRSLVLPIATSPRQVESCNSFAAKLANEHEELAVFGTLHPDYPDIGGQIEFLKKSGIRGIKLHPDFQGYYIDSPQMVGIMKAASDAGLMIYLHGGLDISYPEINRCTPHRVARILPVLGDAVVICAHLGGYGYLSDSIRYLAGTNVFVDTSAVLGYFPNDDIFSVIRAFGADRVLFGTDWPWENPAASIKMLDSLGLAEDELKKIKYLNAAKLFGIE
ncbi:MAG: amidohydrolase family protein [Clostridia bacterium]|nr:amidohydrolase family protein [Clostridia bacterium]